MRAFYDFCVYENCMSFVGFIRALWGSKKRPGQFVGLLYFVDDTEPSKSS